MLKAILSKLFWGVFRHFLSDRQYAIVRYWIEYNRFPDLDNPKRFSEKIQYIKLNEKTELRQKIADRIKVRSFVADKVGEKHLIPLIGNYKSLTEDLWESLPRQFVLKANHGCQMVKVVTDKTAESFKDVQKITRRWQQINYYSLGREWIYKNLPRTIIIEKLLLDQENKVPEDYRFFCFHGSVELVQLDFDRFTNHTRNFYDKDFNLLQIQKSLHNYKHRVEKPSGFDVAINVAETLSADFNFLRVDLYLLKDKVYFGELTNFPSNGFPHFSPDDVDFELGRKLKI